MIWMLTAKALGTMCLVMLGGGVGALRSRKLKEKEEMLGKMAVFLQTLEFVFTIGVGTVYGRYLERLPKARLCKAVLGAKPGTSARMRPHARAAVSQYGNCGGGGSVAPVDVIKRSPNHEY